MKQSENVYALVVYTGIETKLVMNQGQYKYQISTIMYHLNIILLINLGIMLIIILMSSQVGTRLWLNQNADKHSYLFHGKQGFAIDKELIVLQAVGSFYLLMNSLIPMDLAINTIFIKLVYSLIVEVDAEFVDEQKSIEEGNGELLGCNVRNMIKLEDVARVNNIFCDKTGTLTQNKLLFKSLAFGD